MYFGGRPGGQGESPRCFIQAPIWADLNSVHVLQNDGLMRTQTGAMPGSFTLTYGRLRAPSFNETKHLITNATCDLEPEVARPVRPTCETKPSGHAWGNWA